MLEDKKIRISADLSQLRSLRDEVKALNRELVDSTKEQEALNDRAIDQLQKHLSLLHKKNELEQLFNEIKAKTTNVPIETNKQLETNKKPIEERDFQETSSQRKPYREVVSERTPFIPDIREKKEQNIRENIINIDRNVQNITETVSNTRREINQEDSKPPISDRNNLFEPNEFREERRERRDENDHENTRLLDNSINKILEEISQKISTVYDLSSGIWRNILKSSDLSGSRLSSIVDILLSIDENLATQTRTNEERRNTSSNGGGGNNIVPITPITTDDNEEDDDDEENERRYRRRADEKRFSSWDRAGGFGARIISGVGSMAVQDPISMAGQVVSTTGGVLGEGLSMIPGIGNFLGGITTALGNTFAGIIVSTVQQAVAMQRNAVSYSQTMGVSNTEAMSVAGREGSYAASALGMNVGEYIQRRAQLIRSAGGKEETVAPVRETQSLMAVERKYGIQTADQLQGVMRFANEESTRSSSAIIRSMEMTMKELRKPFSEIASTMDESLSTFIRTAEDTLSRAGEIDATKIAATMRTVRLTTGMEGRQLERVQQAAMGIGISQDEVSQAFLHRAVQQTYGSNLQPSQVFEIEENLTKYPEVMERLFDTLQQSVGGVNETFRHVLKSLLPNLSYTDINAWTKSGYFDSKRAAQDINRQSQEALSSENDDINRYAKTEAQKTVSPGEQLMKNWENRMAGWGAENFKYIADINKELNKIFGLMNSTVNKMNDKNFDPRDVDWVKSLGLNASLKERGQAVQKSFADDFNSIKNVLVWWKEFLIGE